MEELIEFCFEVCPLHRLDDLYEIIDKIKNESQPKK